MQQPEMNLDVYPISAMVNGGCTTSGPTYDIVDMRTQEVILRTELTFQQLEDILAQLNGSFRAGADMQIIADEALLLVLNGDMTEIMARDVEPVAVAPALATLPTIQTL